MTMIGTTKYVTSVHAKPDDRDRDLAQEPRALRQPACRMTPTVDETSAHSGDLRHARRGGADALPDRGLAAAQARHDVRDERRVEVDDDEEVADVVAEQHDVEHGAVRAALRPPDGCADERAR